MVQSINYPRVLWIIQYNLQNRLDMEIIIKTAIANKLFYALKLSCQLLKWKVPNKLLCGWLILMQLIIKEISHSFQTDICWMLITFSCCSFQTNLHATLLTKDTLYFPCDWLENMRLKLIKAKIKVPQIKYRCIIYIL